MFSGISRGFDMNLGSLENLVEEEFGISGFQMIPGNQRISKFKEFQKFREFIEFIEFREFR